MRYDVGIIGGGASGLAAAIQIKRANKKRSVALIERQSRVGKKLLSTGNGRCNLTNLSASPSDYHGGVSLMGPAMEAHPPKVIIEFFQSLGIEPLYEGDKVYPLSEQASSVVDALRFASDELGVETISSFEVSAIKKGFVIYSIDKQIIECEKLILALGSPASPVHGSTDTGYRLLKSLGHKLIPCLPALVQLQTPIDDIRPLTGIKFTGSIAVEVNGQPVRKDRGEVLFTNYGLSGPPVLQISGVASHALSKRKTVEAVLSILSEFPLDALKARREMLNHRPLEHFLTGMLNKRLGQTILKLAGCTPLSRPASSLSDFELETLAMLLVRWALPITGTQGLKTAQVCAGGADTSQFEPMTLESKLVPGLYVVGELLDIDGDCGGFNLQWAWASALLAGKAVAQ